MRGRVRHTRDCGSRSRRPSAPRRRRPRAGAARPRRSRRSGTRGDGARSPSPRPCGSARAPPRGSRTWGSRPRSRAREGGPIASSPRRPERRPPGSTAAPRARAGRMHRECRRDRSARSRRAWPAPQRRGSPRSKKDRHRGRCAAADQPGPPGPHTGSKTVHCSGCSLMYRSRRAAN